jgi:NADPH:quinone reductase-like Zn-dependent oxidoreductase
MRAITIAEQGSPVTPNIKVACGYAELSDPGPGEVQISTIASALNHMDIWVGMGIPGVDLTYPRVSGCDACGTVASVGEGVDRSWVGRRVIVNAAVARPERHLPGNPPGSTLAPDYELIGEHHDGMHRDRFNAPAANLAALPDGVDPVDAAAFGLVHLTAYSMMVTKARLRPGQTVLITGIGGGVALAALSICNWMACPAIVTSRHQWKLDRAKKLGASHCVLDEGQDWSKEVRAFTQKRGVDMAVDSVGRPTHLNCIKSLARGGAFVTPGNTGGPRVETDQARIFWNQLRIIGSTMGSTDELRELTALLGRGHLEPIVDGVFNWEDAKKAWERLEGQEQFGKIVLKWD